MVSTWALISGVINGFQALSFFLVKNGKFEHQSTINPNMVLRLFLMPLNSSLLNLLALLFHTVLYLGDEQYRAARTRSGRQDNFFSALSISENLAKFTGYN
jgi:hypothetical protein